MEEQKKENGKLDIELVKKVIKVAEESSISGLTVEKGDLKIEIRKEGSYHSVPVPVAPVHHVAQPAQNTAPAEKKDEDEGYIAITSPMVGTFYRASSPDSAPYVEVGTDIEKGKVVCIIEAMKLFNEIESEISGKVSKILVENGKPVEYGQKLMLIKKN